MIKALTLLIICCFALASARRTSRIINGRRVSESDARGVFGFVAHVSSCDRRGRCSGCTGSLIRSNRVLVAAHCLCGENYKIKVHVQTTQSYRGKSMTGKVIWKAPYKCGRGHHGYQADKDMALIQLDRPLTGVNTVPVDCGIVQPGTEVTMIGFGRDENGRSGTLRYGTRRTERCGNGFPNTLCVDGTNGGLTATNPGDSGGPLLIKKFGRYYQVGVVNGAITRSWKENGQQKRKMTLTWSTTRYHCSVINSRF